MIRKKAGLIGRIMQEMDKQSPEFHVELHYIIHQQSLCRKILKSEHAMKVVVLTLNFIQNCGLDHCQFQYFLLETDTKYDVILNYTKVQWLRHGTLFKHFLALRLKIEMFMNKKGKVVAKSLVMKSGFGIWHCFVVSTTI
jgi:hypothetical protein